MKLFGALALLIITMLGWSVPTSALAQTPWRVMHAQSYPASPAAAAAQARAMGFSAEAAKELETELSRFLANPATSTACRSAVAPDGVIYERMGMVQGGNPHVASNLVKQHGVDRHVVACTIAGRTFHWFNEPVIGCNNLGLVARPKPQPEPPRLRQEVSITPPRVTHIPPLDVCGCVHLPGVTVVTPGHRIQSTIYESHRE